jgi:hypothetical protein
MGMAKKRRIFFESTPLGYRVLLTRASGAETVCVVVGGGSAGRFVITTYLTRAPKKGTDLLADTPAR